MSYSDLTPEVLRELISLVEKKESLLAEITKIDTSISRVVNGDVPSPKVAQIPAPKAKAPKAIKVKRSAKPSVPSTTRTTGSMTERVVKALTGKPEGLSVPELAKLTGAKGGSLHVYFATTGKTKGFMKVGRGVWVYNHSAAPAPTSEPIVTPAPIVEAAAPAAEPTPVPAAEPATEIVPPAPETAATVQPEIATQH